MMNVQSVPYLFLFFAALLTGIIITLPNHFSEFWAECLGITSIKTLATTSHKINAVGAVYTAVSSLNKAFWLFHFMATSTSTINNNRVIVPVVFPSSPFCFCKPISFTLFATKLMLDSISLPFGADNPFSTIIALDFFSFVWLQSCVVVVNEFSFPSPRIIFFKCLPASAGAFNGLICHE